MGLADGSGGHETAAAHSQSSSDSSNVLTPCAEARTAASSTREEDPMFELSDSEELDVLSTEAGDIAESSPLHSPAYEELVEVLYRAVAKLNIQWGKKVFSQPSIVQVLPLKNMREACNFHHRYTSTMRDKIRKKNPENHTVGFLKN